MSGVQRQVIPIDIVTRLNKSAKRRIPYTL